MLVKNSAQLYLESMNSKKKFKTEFGELWDFATEILKNWMKFSYSCKYNKQVCQLLLKFKI